MKEQEQYGEMIPDNMVSANIPISRELADETSEAAQKIGMVRRKFRALLLEDGFRIWKKRQKSS